MVTMLESPRLMAIGMPIAMQKKSRAKSTSVAFDIRLGCFNGFFRRLVRQAQRIGAAGSKVIENLKKAKTGQRHAQRHHRQNLPALNRHVFELNPHLLHLEHVLHGAHKNEADVHQAEQHGKDGDEFALAGSEQLDQCIDTDV